MELLIVIAVVLSGIALFFGELGYRTWRVGHAAKELGFESDLPPFRKTVWERTMRGYRVRIVLMELVFDQPASVNPHLYRRPSSSGTSYIAAGIRLDLPEIDRIYLATPGTTKVEKIEAMKLLEGFSAVEDPNFPGFFGLSKLGSPAPLQLEFEYAKPLRTVMDDLAETYDVVQLDHGWLTVANATRDADTIDVDLSNLCDAAVAIGAPQAAQGSLTDDGAGDRA